MNKLLERFLKAKVNVMPTCMHYGELLSLAVTKLGITESEARKKYGQFTYAEWAKLLKIEESEVQDD